MQREEPKGYKGFWSQLMAKVGPQSFRPAQNKPGLSYSYTKCDMRLASNRWECGSDGQRGRWSWGSREDVGASWSVMKNHQTLADSQPLT